MHVNVYVTTKLQFCSEIRCRKYAAHINRLSCDVHPFYNFNEFQQNVDISGCMIALGFLSHLNLLSK